MRWVDNYILYQTNDEVWFSGTKNWNRLKYKPNINPIRMELIQMSNEYANDLMEIMKQSPNEFAELIVGYLNEWTPIYSN